MAKIVLPIETILKKYLDGASLHELASEYKTYPNKILRLLRKVTTIRKKSDARKNAVARGRAIHPTEGKKRSSEEKLSISEGLEDFYRQMDKKTYNKIVDRAKKNWKKLSKDTRQQMQRKSAESNRKAAKEGSSVEKYIKEILEENKFFVDFHKKNILNTNLEVDLFLPNESVAIEIDGPSHYHPIWGDDALARQVKYDTEKNGVLLGLGLVLIRIKYDRSNFSLGVKSKIKKELMGLLAEIKKSFPPENKRLIKIEV